MTTVNTELLLYKNSNKLFNSLFRELDEIFKKKISSNETIKFKTYIEKFNITKDSIIKSLNQININKYNHIEEREHIVNYRIMNINQIKINISALENIIKSKETFEKDYKKIKEKNIKINQMSYNLYIDSIREITTNSYPNLNNFNSNTVIDNKHKLYNLTHEYNYTFFEEFKRMRNKNTSWLKNINSELIKKYIKYNILIKELKSNQYKLSQKNQSNSRNKLLFIEEELPKYQSYILELKKSFHSVTTKNPYKVIANCDIFKNKLS